jgi:YHS domain-containing protein
MFNFLFRFIALLVAFAVIRSIIGMIARFFKQVTQNTQVPANPNQPPIIQSGGELRKDPVCGTFVSTGTSLKKTVNGEVIYFCSTTCRDKFKLA